LTIEMWVATDKYRDNYDKIFGKKPTVLSWKEDNEPMVSESGKETPSEVIADATGR